MIGLVLIACHMLGDFVLANRWMAAKKLTDWRWRSYHVAVYLTPFVPAAFALAPSYGRAAVFLAAVYVCHWLTDCRRFRSTLGDRLEWWAHEEAFDIESDAFFPLHPLPPNPWDPIPLLIDQSLHLAQLAALGWVLT